MQLVSIAQIIQNVNKGDFFIVDSVLPLKFPSLEAALKDKKVFYLENPEACKNLEYYSECMDYLLENNITRQHQIISIGGGATSDFAGFVAATILRGVPWSVIPTTLLAMIDASIGGKVALNNRFGKNLLGQFHLPSEILICEDFLETLPPKELNSAKGELIKYCFLSKEIYELVSAGSSLSKIIGKCVEFKQEIVAKDFKETGIRKILNLGHSFGHPIEKLTHLPHGVAVILGLRLIIHTYAPECIEDLDEMIKKLDVKVDISPVNFDKFISLLTHDKKMNKNNIMDLIIPAEMGKVYIETKSLDQIIQDLKSLKNYANFF